MKIDAAYILCAGLGTRMGEVGKILPKPLWPFFEKTFLDFRITQLRALGINNIIINTHHCADQIKEYVRKNYDSQIKILHEPVLLGSGGAIHNLKKHFPMIRKVLVLNTDFFFDITNELLQNAIQVMDDALVLLFCVAVSHESRQNQVCVQGRRLNSIVKHSMILKGSQYEASSGISIIDLAKIKYQEGTSEFFSTVADLTKDKVCVFSESAIDWYELGTKESYKEFFYQCTSAVMLGEKNKLFEMLISHSYLKPQKLSLEGYGAGRSCSKVFNFDPQWICPSYIPDETFILRAPLGPVDAPGIYCGDHADKV